MQITNMTFKEKCDKVIDALEVNRVMAADADGNYTKEVTPKVIAEAIAIMRGLAEGEPVAWMTDDGKRLDTPTAAQTEAALREVVRLSEDVRLYDEKKTEAQEREAFEAWARTMFMKPKLDFNEWKKITEYQPFIQAMWNGWQARAGRKG